MPDTVYLNQSGTGIRCMEINMNAPHQYQVEVKIHVLYMFVIKLLVMHVCLRRIHGPEFVKKWLEPDGHEQKVAELPHDLLEKGGLRLHCCYPLP